MKSFAPTLLLAVVAAGCATQRPQTITPIIRDTGKVVMVLPPQVSSPPPLRVWTTMRDDPFFSVDRIDLAGPNVFRSSNGAPGPSYWQQRADYTIAATLDTTAKTVSGRVAIRYTNNSPDTLRFVWLQIEQNLYRANSLGSAIFPPDSRFGVRGFEGGYTFRSISVNGKAATPQIEDTMMRLDLDTPLAPRGGVATMAIAFSFPVPEHGSDRMGRDSTLYEIAQWYPRMAVYDDVRGWNTDPYLGQGEFYLEYGDIDYSVTAPAGYTIAASGVLQNPDEVLSAEHRSRLARASKASDVVPIITETEAKATPTPGTKTWRFRTQNVRDVAWAGAPDFRWDATSWNGVLCQAFYQWPKAGAEWTHVAENNQWTIRTYSELFLPYPYPMATSVAGPVAGMEYPMFVMDGYTDPRDKDGVFRTNDHEQGHEWFPMIVGSNERRYAWMDEGINTYINTFSQERRYGADVTKWPQGMDNMLSWVASWRQTLGAAVESPLMTRPDQVDPRGLGTVGYRKPGVVLLTLRNHVVGRETFDRAFREYTRRWAFKHPTPADFFRTIENGSGQDLSWFWRAFFYSTDVLDLGIESVANTKDSAGTNTATIVVRRTTSVPFPVIMRLKLADGSSEDVRLPVDIWARTDRYEAHLATKAPVTGVRLWPDGTVPDWNSANDSWGDAPSVERVKPATVGGLMSPIAP